MIQDLALAPAPNRRGAEAFDGNRRVRGAAIGQPDAPDFVRIAENDQMARANAREMDLIRMGGGLQAADDNFGIRGGENGLVPGGRNIEFIQRRQGAPIPGANAGNEFQQVFDANAGQLARDAQPRMVATGARADAARAARADWRSPLAAGRTFVPEGFVPNEVSPEVAREVSRSSGMAPAQRSNSPDAASEQ